MDITDEKMESHNNFKHTNQKVSHLSSSCVLLLTQQMMRKRLEKRFRAFSCSTAFSRNKQKKSRERITRRNKEGNTVCLFQAHFFLWKFIPNALSLFQVNSTLVFNTSVEDKWATDNRLDSLMMFDYLFSMIVLRDFL